MGMFFSAIYAALWRIAALVLPSKRWAGVRHARVLRGNYFTDLALIAIVLIVLAAAFGLHRSFATVMVLVVVAMGAALAIDSWRQRTLRAMRDEASDVAKIFE
jgi:type IV secretory pathway VirB2 component (pilin)